jgi:hypothetical protein
MFRALEPQAGDLEVYRNTPYEHLSTAGAGQLIVICTAPISAPAGWVTKAGFVRFSASFPGWMPRSDIAHPAPSAF